MTVEPARRFDNKIADTIRLTWIYFTMWTLITVNQRLMRFGRRYCDVCIDERCESDRMRLAFIRFKITRHDLTLKAATNTINYVCAVQAIFQANH